MIRIPVDGADNGRAIVLDTETCTRIYNELVRWGHHYNQAVHSLNTVQLFIDCSCSNTEYFVEQLDKTNRLLGETEAGRKEVIRQMRNLESTTLIGG